MQTPQTIDEYLSLRAAAKEQSKLTVVKFTADWCNVCKTVQPRLDALANEFPNVQFISYDAENLENADSADITALPTFKIFNGDRLVEAFSGDKVDRIRKVLKQ